MNLSKHSYIFFLLILFSFSNTLAQKVRVKDQLTKLPIHNVLIFNSGEVINSYQTNEKGEVILKNYAQSELITFQHTGYQTLTIPFNKLAEMDFTIFLEERIISIDEVTVSANKWEEDKTEVANDILSLNARDIKFSNPATSADLLANSGEVFVQKSQLGGGSPMLRGFAANSVLMVIDGVRMNNAIYRNGNLQNIINIDPNALQSAEVVFGPGSVIYGSDALGGVMNFVTINPKLSSSKKRYLRGGAFTRYSSAASEKTGHFHVELGKKNFSLFSSLTWTDFNDLKTGNKRTNEFPDFGKRPFYVRTVNGNDQLIPNTNPNVQTDSGYRLLNMIQKIRFRPNQFLDIDYGFYYSTTSDIPRYDRLIQTQSDGSLRNSEWYYGPQNWSMHRASLISYKNTLLFDQLKLTMAYQDYEESRNDRRFGSTSLRNQTEKVDIYSINLDLDKSLSGGNIFYGLEFLYNNVNSNAFRKEIETGEITATGTRYPDLGSTYQSLSAYLNYKYRINEKLIFNTGIRFSTVKLNAETSDGSAIFLENNKIELDNSAINGTAGLVWKKSDKITYSALVSSGFRSPNVDDVGKVFEIDANDLVVPNAELKPELSYNAEISIKNRLNNKLIFDLVMYHSWLTNAIARGAFEVNGSSTIMIAGETFNVFSQKNLSGARIYGFSAKLQYTINNFWLLKTNLNFTDGKEDETNEPLRHTPPVFGKTSILFKKEKLKIEGFLEFSGAKTFDNLAPSEKAKTDIYTSNGSLAWYTLNLKSSYQINKILQANTGIENILNTHYRTYSSGISAPGRNFIISLSAQF